MGSLREAINNNNNNNSNNNNNNNGSSLLLSLPAPQPKSPPEYPDLYGKRRELAKLQMLEREISFLQEELKSVEGLQPASKSCKEVTDFVTGNVDPIIPTTKKTSTSCRFWKWLCGVSCFNMSWICCCCSCSRCCPKKAFCHDCCSICKCSGSCLSCRMPKCNCFSSCWNSKCCKKPTCSCGNCSCCCIPKCSLSCSTPKCTCCCYPKCPKFNLCSSCHKNCCCCPCYICC